MRDDLLEQLAVLLHARVRLVHPRRVEDPLQLLLGLDQLVGDEAGADGARRLVEDVLDALEKALN